MKKKLPVKLVAGVLYQYADSQDSAKKCETKVLSEKRKPSHQLYLEINL
jgi:hypothetical protein